MIKKLAPDISTRIAAGEVIERPSSVAKELIENSLDAGARTISIQTEQGGKSSFVIEDDGCGIPCAELPLALERYATSKITDIEDLERISTLGIAGRRSRASPPSRGWRYAARRTEPAPAASSAARRA